MKAAVFHGPQDVRFEEIDAPALADGDVLLRVKACGICGSDLHTYKHGMFQQLGNPIEQGRVLGHEFSGEVIATGGPIPGVNLGDRVTSIGVGANAFQFYKRTRRIRLLTHCKNGKRDNFSISNSKAQTSMIVLFPIGSK